MKFKVNKSKCAGCGACLRVCPHGAIKIGADGKAFIDQGKCKRCGTCQRICPFNAIEKISDKEKTEQSKTLFPRPPALKTYRPLPTGGRGLGRGGGQGWSKGIGRKRRFRGGRN